MTNDELTKLRYEEARIEVAALLATITAKIEAHQQLPLDWNAVCDLNNVTDMLTEVSEFLGFVLAPADDH